MAANTNSNEMKMLITCSNQCILHTCVDINKAPQPIKIYSFTCSLKELKIIKIKVNETKKQTCDVKV